MYEINEVSQIGYGLYLCVLSGMDITKRQIPLWLLALGGAGVTAVQFFEQQLPVFLILAGVAVGIVFLAVSKFTEEGLGYGDSILILITGIYLGFWELLGVLMGAFLFSAVFSVIFLIKKKFDRHVRYPFVPFFMAAYVVWILIGGQ